MAARKRGVSLSHNMFVAFVAVCTVAALVVTAASAYVYERAFLDDEHEQLAGECQTLASLLDSTDNDEEVLAGLSMGSLRATLVAPDGRVLFDSGADAAGLPNHADRPEVSDALATGTGSSERSSETVGYVSLYEARRLGSGDVLRISVDRAGAASFLTRDLALLVVVAVCVVAASWGVSRLLVGRFVRPILEIDATRADASAPYEELEPLVSRLNEQRGELLERMSAIQDADDAACGHLGRGRAHPRRHLPPGGRAGLCRPHLRRRAAPLQPGE